MKNKINEIKQIASQNPDGFTIRTTDLTHLEKGWVVAKKETQNSFGDKGFKKALQIAEETTQRFGGWKEGQKFYWDAVMVFDDEEAATQAGRENDQISIYQIETNRLKFL